MKDKEIIPAPENTIKDGAGQIFPAIYCDIWEFGLKFYCKYCKREHKHGVGHGHRVAHCSNPDSPYLKTGYYLVCKTKGECNCE
jgi:hypothetical protein